jgi:hypothetical protein
VKNKRERSMSVRPPGVQQTSRLGLRDLVANGVKCEPHGGKNNKTKSWTVSWLILKTKVEPGLCGCQDMSGDWWEATPSLWGFLVVHHKTTRFLG